MPEILTDGITELHQAGKRVGLVFQGSGGAEHWAISPGYDNPGASSTHVVSFARPTDPKITASNPTEFQAVLTNEDIWDSTWTYLKKDTELTSYDQNSTSPPPYPSYPLPAGDQPVSAPQGLDIGTGSLFEGQNQVGTLYREGTATSAQWQETWVLYSNYPADPGGKVDIKGAGSQNDANRDAFLTRVRNAWRAGTRVFTASVVHYKGDMPTP